MDMMTSYQPVRNITSQKLQKHTTNNIRTVETIHMSVNLKPPPLIANDASSFIYAHFLQWLSSL